MTLHELRHARTQAAGKLKALESHMSGNPNVDSTRLQQVERYPAIAAELRTELYGLDKQIEAAQEDHDAERAARHKTARLEKPKLVKALRRLGAALDEVEAASAEVETHRRIVAEGYDARRIPIITVPGIRGVVQTMQERLELAK